MKIKELAPLIRGGRWDAHRTLNIRNVYTDIDKTIAHRDSLEVVSPYITKTFSMLTAAGINSGLQTARPFQKAQPILEETRPNGYSVMSNGAEILKTVGGGWEMVHEWAMPRPGVLKLAQALQHMDVAHDIQDSGLDFRWDGKPKHASAPGLGDYTKPVDVRLPLSPTNSRPSPDYWPQKPFVIVAKDIRPTDLPDMIGIANDYTKYGIIASIGSHSGRKEDDSLRHEVFFTDYRATKGFAARLIADKDYLNVPLSQTLAVGDGWNDLGMLLACGHSGAVGNAIQEVKDAARVIGPDYVENGAGIIMRRMTGLDLTA